MINPSIFRTFLLSASWVLVSGCAVVGVRIKDESAHSLRRDALDAARLNGAHLAAAQLARANQPSMATCDKLAALIEATELTRGAPPESPLAKINRAATTQIVSLMQAANFAPLDVRGSKHPLTIRRESKNTLNPQTADRLIRADSISIRGLRRRTRQSGLGVPYVAWFAPKSPALRGQAGIPPLAGLSEPVTALVETQTGQPELIFYRTLQTDSVKVKGRNLPLSADYSGQLAYLIAQGRNRSLDIQALFFTDRNMDNAGLYQFERFDPDKIPVVLIHGLMSRPETWSQAVNQLLADPEVRARYQFWFFLYPTGLPVWMSAAKLRGELDRFRNSFDPGRRNRNLDRVVLAGHSMGGLISSLQIRAGGRNLWQQFTDTPPEKLRVSAESKRKVLEIVDFKPRQDVARVVFFATPHQGSGLAVNPVVKFFSDMVRLPFSPFEYDRLALVQAVHEDLRDLFVAPANSLVFLRARSPLLMAILKLPLNESVPYHSIIGDRGKGNTPDSSDGVVPYWSSHLPGASSEKIVPSGHGANEHPAGIDEFRRILSDH
jgi:pimeloyl-ACP methyl ester carboxylesterase